MPGLLEQLADPAGLVGRHDHAPPAGCQLQQPRPGPFGTARQRRGRAVAGILVGPLLEPLVGASASAVRVAAASYGGGHASGSSPGCDQAGAAVGGLGVEVAGEGGQLVVIGQDEVASVREVVGGRAGGQERRPRLGRLAEVALLEPGDVLAQLVGRQGRRTAADARPAIGRQELGSGKQVDRRQRDGGEACVIGSKLRIDSISSPNSSIRTGSAAPGGQASMRPPRCANSAMPVTSATGS